jgi:hypothetical protein
MDRLQAGGAGGPNLPFPDAGWQERAISGAPGPPLPVVGADGRSTHLAGCNMAFLREAVLETGGFDAAWLASYDDIDFCFRVLDRGHELVLHPGAAVLHHRRDTISGFLKQQRGYGETSASGEQDHGGRQVVHVPRRTLLERLDPRRPRYVFDGPQPLQLYTLETHNMNAALPLKALAAVVGVSLLAAVPAARADRLGLWSAATGATVLAVFGTVAARVPVFAPPPGPRGLGQRLATAALWFAMPVARELGRRRARRAP